MSSFFRGDVRAFRPARVAKGHEQQGQRYAVVLQTNEFHWLNTVVVAPTSTGRLRTLRRTKWLKSSLHLAGFSV